MSRASSQHGLASTRSFFWARLLRVHTSMYFVYVFFIFFIGRNLLVCVLRVLFYEMIPTVKLCVFVQWVRVTVYKIVLSLLKCMCHDKAIVARDCHLATAQIVCVCEREGEQSRESPALRPQAAAAFTVCLNASTTLDLAAKHTQNASAHRQPVLLQPPSHPYTHIQTQLNKVTHIRLKKKRGKKKRQTTLVIFVAHFHT